MLLAITRQFSTRSKDAGRITGRLQSIDSSLYSVDKCKDESNPYLTLVTYHYNKNEYVTRYKTCDLNRRIELLRARQKVKS